MSQNMQMMEVILSDVLLLPLKTLDTITKLLLAPLARPPTYVAATDAVNLGTIEARYPL